MDNGTITGIVAIVVVVAKAIYDVVNHKRCRSTCCGIKTEATNDIENTTPPTEKPALTIPLPPMAHRGGM